MIFRWSTRPRSQVPTRRRNHALRPRPPELLEGRALLTAMSYTVNSLGDTGTGTGTTGDLRYCVTQANQNAGSTIDFSVSGTISLGSGLTLTADTTINGPSPLLLTIQGGGGSSFFSIFRVNTGVTASISDVTLSNGRNFAGGAILNFGNLTLDVCAVAGNAATLSGGGAANYGSLTVRNSLFGLNTSGFTGGAIANFRTMTVVNSTFTLNQSKAGGGGIYSNGTLNSTNCTICANQAGSSLSSSAPRTATNAGGGLDVLGAATLKNTIVALNVFGTGFALNDIVGRVNTTDSASNLIGTGGSGGLVDGTNGNLVGVADPGLDTLADNGGPTMTVALLSGSPAIDAGDNMFIAAPPFLDPPFTDQRGTGFERFVDGGSETDTVDIGAYEFGAGEGQGGPP